MTSIMHVWQRRTWLQPSTSGCCCRHTVTGQDLIPFKACICLLATDPHPTIKWWCQVGLPFTKSKTIFQIEMHCMQCFLKSKYIKIRSFNDKNRWIIKQASYGPQKAASSSYYQGNLHPRELKVWWSVARANIGVPSSDVPAEVELLHMIIESHGIYW